MTPNYAEARRFIDELYDYDILSFQVATKNEELIEKGIVKPGHKHGTLDENWDWLREQNSVGGNVYIMANQGDGKGRSMRNVTALRTVLVDLDGAPLNPVLALARKPHLITETSKGRYQGIWRIKPISVNRSNRYDIDDLYKRLHSGIAEKFKADKAGKALSHVFRLPGFINYNHQSLFSVSIYEINKWDSDPSAYEVADYMDVDLSVPYVQSNVGMGPSETPVDLLSQEPILYHTRTVTILRICNKLAYNRVRGESLVQAVLGINAARCKPPLIEREVRRVANNVERHFQKYSNNQVIADCIKVINFGLSNHNGNFYKYDPIARKYRMIGLVPLRNKIWELSHRTADDIRIREILKMLSDQVPYRENLDNQEKQFIKECLVRGGKSVLQVIHDQYIIWCKENGIQPVSQACLNKEMQSMFPGTFRGSLKVGKRTYVGFLGISLNESSNPSSPIFEPCSYKSTDY